MNEPATGQRSLLQALRVPFDLKGVGVGALAYLAWTWGFRLIADRGPDSATSFRIPGMELLDLTPGNPEGWLRWSVLLALAVAAVFGVACCRIAAVRLARDEGVGLGEAIGFSLSNICGSLCALLFMGGAIALFFACNALAGLAAGIPGIGPILAVPLLPLVLLSTLLLFLLNYGALLGMPLVLASLAVERNGALDAVSRGFSYVFSRPALFFLFAATVGGIAALLLYCAISMEGLAVRSFTAWYGDGETQAAVSRAVHVAFEAAGRVRMPEFAGIGGAAVLAGWAAWLAGTGFHLALLGYAVYYVFGGATAAYLALRQDVDGTEDEEIWMDGAEESFGEPERPRPAPAPGAGDAPPPAPPSA